MGMSGRHVCGGIENFNKILFFTGKHDTLAASASVTQSVVLELTGIVDYFVTTITPMFLCFRLCVSSDSVPVEVNRRGVPKELTTTKLTNGEVLTAQTKDGTPALKWMDKRPVTLLSTIYDDTR